MNTALQDIVSAANSDNASAVKGVVESSTESTDTIVEVVRQAGCFRSSRFGFRPTTPLQLLDSLVSRPDKGSDETKSYLLSVATLLQTAKAAMKERRRVVEAINSRSFKSYLATVDAFFHVEGFIRTADSEDQLGVFSKEELAAAFSSYFVHLAERGLTISPEDLGFIHFASIENNEYVKRLHTFYCLNELREIEILIDCYGYVAREVDGIIRINPPSENFGQARELGYIRQTAQTRADMHELHSSGLKHLPSLYEAVAGIVEKAGDFFFEVAEKPSKRIRFRLPEGGELFDHFNSEAINREEFVELRILAKELFVDFEQIQNQVIFKSVTIKDLIKFKRMFVFMTVCFHEYCKKHGYLRSELYYKSIIGLYPLPVSKHALSRIYGESKLAELFELLSWDPKVRSVFDVQYQPIIKCQQHYVVPTGILAHSNIARNTLQLTRFRFYPDNAIDPVSQEIENTFRAAGFQIFQGVSYSFAGAKGEIDILALRDGGIFAFECKNSLLPCSDFELRTSWDYIKKAASQLNQVRRLWGVAGFADYLAKKLKTTIPQTAKLGTSVVMGNRMFPGLLHEEQPVRSVYELCNFVRTGVWVLEASGDGSPLGKAGVYEFNLWKGTSFSVDDLFDYIGDGSLGRVMLESLEPSYQGFKLKSYKVAVRRYGLNYETMIRAALERWKYTYSPPAAGDAAVTG